jgi:hypothetical protein
LGRIGKGMKRRRRRERGELAQKKKRVPKTTQGN